MVAFSPGYATPAFARPMGQAMMFVEAFWMGLGAACLFFAHKWWKRALLFCAFPLPLMFFVLLTPAVVTIADDHFGTTEERTKRFLAGESNVLYGVDIPAHAQMRLAQ